MSPPPPLKLAVIHRGDVVVVIPRGEIDGFTATALEDALQRCARQGADDVVIDLSDVAFMDLRGVDAIVRGAADIAERAGRTVVRYPSQLVLLMFEMTGECPGLTVDRSTGSTEAGPGHVREHGRRPLELVPTS